MATSVYMTAHDCGLPDNVSAGVKSTEESLGRQESGEAECTLLSSPATSGLSLARFAENEIHSPPCQPTFCTSSPSEHAQANGFVHWRKRFVLRGYEISNCEVTVAVTRGRFSQARARANLWVLKSVTDRNLAHSKKHCGYRMQTTISTSVPKFYHHINKTLNAHSGLV